MATNEQIQGVSVEVIYTPKPNVSFQVVNVEVLLQFPAGGRRRPVYVVG